MRQVTGTSACLNGESAALSRAEVRKQVGVIEEEAREWREVMGMEKVSAVAFADAPSIQEALFGTEPAASGSDAQERNWAQRWLAEFTCARSAGWESRRQGAHL